MSSILVDTQATDTQTTASAYANVPGLGDTGVNVTAGTVLLLIATIPAEMPGAGDKGLEMRFAIDGAQEGPTMIAFQDAASEGCGASLCYAKTGLSGTHEFRIEWRTQNGGTQHYTTTAERNFQVIEITDATLLVDLTATDVANATSGYADIPDLVTSVGVTTGAIHLILSNWFQDDESDANGFTQFHIDNVGTGYEINTFSDASNESCAYSGMWFTDGLTGTVEFAMQWDEGEANMRHRSGFERKLQVIEITSNVNKLVEQTSVAAGSLGASFADVPGLVASGITVAGTDSILLQTAGITPDAGGTDTGDDTGEFRMGFDGAEEGPLQHIFEDRTDPQDDFCGHSVYYAVTGKSSGTHTFSLRGINRTGDFVFGPRRRGIAVVELLPAALLDERQFMSAIRPSIQREPMISILSFQEEQEINRAVISWQMSKRKKNVKPTIFLLTINGVLSFVGDIVKKTLKQLSGTQTSTGTLVNKIKKLLSGSLTLTGDLQTSLQLFVIKIMSAIRPGISRSVIIVGIAKERERASERFVSWLTRMKRLVRVPTIINLLNVSGVLSFTGDFSKKTNKVLTGILTFTGDITKKTSKVLTGSLSFVGNLLKQTNKILVGSLSFSGTIVKKTLKILSGSLSLLGTFQTKLIPFIVKIMAAILPGIKRSTTIVYIARQEEERDIEYVSFRTRMKNLIRLLLAPGQPVTSFITFRIKSSTAKLKSLASYVRLRIKPPL